MGFVDRGGGREAKGASLRRSKKNPGAPSTRNNTAKKASTGPAAPQPPPPLAAPGAPRYVDAGCALLARAYDDDRDAVLRRARESIAASIVWSADIDKQKALAQLSAERPGAVYCALGAHPDNIDRTNQRAQGGWSEMVEEAAKGAGCVAFISGLNLTREVGTHFAQESLFRSMYNAAATQHRALILHVAAHDDSVDRALSLLAECTDDVPSGADDDDEAAPAGSSDGPVAVILHSALAACRFNPVLVKRVAQAGVYMSISAAELATVEAKRGAACIAAVPKELLLLCTDGPWHTPQCVPDEYLRTQKNEPCNMEFVAEAVAAVAEKGTFESPLALADLAAANALRVFRIPLAGAAPAPAPAAAEAEAAAVATEAAAPAKGGVALPPTAAAAAAAAAAAPARAAEAAAPAAAPAAAAAAATAPAAEVNMNIPAPVIGARASLYYTCQRCRAQLFSSLDAVTHPAGAAVKGGAARGKVDDRAPCGATLFVGPAKSAAEDEDEDVEVEDDGADPALPAGLRADPTGAIECAGCSARIGRCGREQTCGCGRRVPGYTARITASKVDTIDDGASLEDLVRRSGIEAERLAEEDSGSESSDDGKRKKRNKVNVKQNNRSNLCHFRNKDFKPKKGSVAEEE